MTHANNAQLADLMRPGVPRLVQRITGEVRRAVPEYARPADGVYARATKQGVERAVTLFVDLVADPLAPRHTLHETCRRLGAGEARAGRTLDDLHAAFRVGTRVGWRAIMRVGQRHGLPSQVMSWLAEMLFGYADELAKASFEGYREAQAELDEAQPGLRRRLLHLILDDQTAPARAIADLARVVGWPVPDRVAAVAVSPRPDCPTIPLSPDVLADLEPPHPRLLLPAPVHTDRSEKLAAELGGAHLTIGPPVTLTDASHSLRWARQAEHLSTEGILTDATILYCTEHLTTIWLLSDERLITQLAEHHLDPLTEFPVKLRPRLADTLLSWLAYNGNIRSVATDLNVHPQTVRYRLRLLEPAFGERLHDPDARLAIQAALRAAQLRRTAREERED